MIASIAYMDPGNFATNIQAGAAYGYGLLWVVLLANALAILFQGMSARLGIVTGRNLAELSRAHFPKHIVWAMWLVSEVAAMATDLAEFLGGAIGLSLLIHLPLLYGMIVTGAVTYGVLELQRLGYRPFEYVIAAMVGIIGGCYLLELAVAPPNWGAAAIGTVVPHLADRGAVWLSVGIVGATVMPHAIYLHSGLTQDRVVIRNRTERLRLIRFTDWEVPLALGFAGLINMAMVIVAADAFNHGHQDVAQIETAYHMLGPLLGSAAAGLFLVALMASGISSSAVGTIAGQIIMQGFVGFKIPIWLRRLVTMVPAFAVVALGYDATTCLVISQIVLSLALPVPILALIMLSGRKTIMGEFVSGRLAQTCAVIGCIIVLTLNLALLLQLSGVNLPGL